MLRVQTDQFPAYYIYKIIYIYNYIYGSYINRNNIYISQSSFHTFDMFSRFFLDHLMNIAIDWAENPTARRVQVDPTTVPLRTKWFRRLAAHIAGVDSKDGIPTATGEIPEKTWSFQWEKHGKSQWKNMEKQEIPIFNGKHMENPL